MPAFLSGFELRLYASKRRARKYLSSGPFYEMYIDGKLVDRRTLRDASIFYRSLLGWRRCGYYITKKVPVYNIGSSFMLFLEPLPKFDVEVIWKFQLISGRRFKKYVVKGDIGEIVHI